MFTVQSAGGFILHVILTATQYNEEFTIGIIKVH